MKLKYQGRYLMKLKDYFKKYSINKAGFAKNLGVSRSYIYWLIKGGIPSIEAAKKIEEATEGKVTKEELLFPEDAR